MAKRKSKADPEDLPDAPSSKGQDANDSGSDDDMDIVNVDFEWFDPQPAIDFHGLKTLLRQLLDVDSQLFDLSALTDLILSQPTLGSTVKVDGNETDPYAFLTVLNLHVHADKPVIKELTAYLLRKFPEQLGALLAEDSKAQVGLILTERFINMPHEIVPPMYSMLLEEITWATEESEPYNFTHYLVLSKRYSEIQSNLPSQDAPRTKKQKAGKDGEETFFFHPEDEMLHKHALGWTDFEYDTPVDEGASDSKRAFQELGVKPKGHLVLIEGDKFEGSVEAVKKYLGGQ